MLSIGLMSGTSMDGIDAALIETDGAHHIKAIAHVSLPYSPLTVILLKSAEYAVRQNKGNLAQAKLSYPNLLPAYLAEALQLDHQQVKQKIIQLNHYLGGNHSLQLDAIIRHSTDLHLQAVRKLLAETEYKAHEIDVIGYHGQTLFHQPLAKKTIAIGDGAFLAEQAQITVINDFRQHDVQLGGQGAPLAPIYHQGLAVRDKQIPMIVANCGGIANLTIIPSAEEKDLIGYDTGPGNGLLDRLVRLRTQGREHMDRDAQYARQGHIHDEVLKSLYAQAIQQQGQNYFQLPVPKSLDINDMVLIPALEKLSLADACATLAAFTADSIVQSVDLLNIEVPLFWVLAGGGWHNPVIYAELVTRLQKKLGIDIKVKIADEIGWQSQALEAQIFAYLAVRSLQNKALSVPGTTRVPQPLSGGHAYIPSTGCTVTVQKLIAANPAVLNGYFS